MHIHPNHGRTVKSGDVDIYGYVSPTVTFPDTKNPTTSARQAHRIYKLVHHLIVAEESVDNLFGLATMKPEIRFVLFFRLLFMCFVKKRGDVDLVQGWGKCGLFEEFVRPFRRVCAAF